MLASYLVSLAATAETDEDDLSRPIKHATWPIERPAVCLAPLAFNIRKRTLQDMVDQSD